ncbi:transposase, partial [Shigella dysenteriae]|nr:transposase [Shigella dysenteriae]EGD7661872.1 transposase [Shigella boydii]
AREQSKNNDEVNGAWQLRFI